MRRNCEKHPKMSQAQRLQMVRVTLRETVDTMEHYQMRSHNLADLHFLSSTGQTLYACDKLLGGGSPPQPKLLREAELS